LSQLAPPARDAQGVSASLKILVLLTVLSLAPSILIMMTSFTRIVVVLALLRQALGTQQLPPGQVLVGLALIMTMIVMAPTWQRMKTDAVDPYLDGKLGQTEAFDRGAKPLREFMLRQIKAADNDETLYMFAEYARGPLPKGVQLHDDDVRLTELIPSFVLSELETAFVMGFRIYLPFLVIDMVISAILISMGMMMLPPVLISLPFKLMLFVLADGWGLVVGSLLQSFG
jgi:flagellar biosynthetic protein FliP